MTAPVPAPLIRGGYPGGILSGGSAVARAVLGGLPPELIRTAGSGTAPARRVEDGWRKADTARRRIAATLSAMRATRTATDADGRVALESVEIDTGAALPLVVELDGRPLRPDWEADPQAAARALNDCGRGGGVHRTGDGWGAHAYGCTSPLCPSCSRRAAGKRAAEWGRALEHLHGAGYRLVHLTLTQRTRPGAAGAPCVLDAGEAPWHPHTAVRVGRSTPGEGIGAALDRLRASFTALRDGRASRDWWRRSVVGYLYGVEWTGRAPRTQRLRWHAHAHVLIVLAPGTRIQTTRTPAGVLLSGGWIARLRERWSQVADAAGAGQRARVVDTADDIGAAVREVLKYPFKPGECTRAQLAEVLGSCKGRRFHLPGGAFHGASTVGRAARELSAGVVDAWDQLGAVDQARAEHVAAAYRAAEADNDPPEVLYRALSDLDGATPEARRRVARRAFADGAPAIPVTVAELARAALSDDVPLIDGWMWDGWRWHAAVVCPMEVLASMARGFRDRAPPDA